ncbi:MAG: DNA mismatch repair protein MutL [Chlamydiae bacterium]|nr:DNA mismatch repair protein MutL [Chlamydiota bacterium]
MIHVLSDETINQIAAGEVIESPASVVKELVENALDAGSRKITVEITGGGLKLIRVSDDGSGMNCQDAKMCILRHATSKISKAQDLFHIVSKGFRGEALASIASISKIVVCTAKEGEPGTRLEIEKGLIIKESSCARMHGTTFEIRSLFYNVPARKKFQKTAAAISAEIFRIVMVMSLSHPEVQFELISNGRKAIKTLSSGLEERIEEQLGKEFAQGSFALDFKQGSMHFYGVLGAPTNTRNNKMGQYLFLNKRAVTCEPITEAVRDGYATRLDGKRHPIFLLHLDVPSDLVDVNVHPQKLQVRLRKEDLFRDTVKEAVKSALAVKTPIGEVSTFEPVEVNFEEVSLRFQETAEELEFELEEGEIEMMGQSGRFVFLIDPSFDGVVVMDAHAARYRVLFEDLLEKSDQKGNSQGLLIPFCVDLTPVESAMVLTHQEAIERLGFSLKAVGKDTFMVEAIPSFAEENAIKMMIVDMANGLQEFIGKYDYEKERQKKLVLIAARFASSKNMYSKEEARQLFHRLQQCQSPLHCPKGNPTTVYLNHDAIENLFAAHQETAKSAKK